MLLLYPLSFSCSCLYLLTRNSIVLLTDRISVSANSCSIFQVSIEIVTDLCFMISEGTKYSNRIKFLHWIPNISWQFHCFHLYDEYVWFSRSHTRSDRFHSISHTVCIRQTGFYSLSADFRVRFGVRKKLRRIVKSYDFWNGRRRYSSNAIHVQQWGPGTAARFTPQPGRLRKKFTNEKCMFTIQVWRRCVKQLEIFRQ